MFIYLVLDKHMPTHAHAGGRREGGQANRLTRPRGKNEGGKLNKWSLWAMQPIDKGSSTLRWEVTETMGSSDQETTIGHS